MYLIKRLFALLLILTLLFAIFFGGRSFLVWLDSAEPVDARSNTETRSNVQWLSSEKPLRFTFSNQRTHSLRILSNAVFDQSVFLELPVNYAIKYVLYDDKGNVILDKIYHHASKLVNNSEEQQIKQIIENKQSLNVASGQSFYLPITHYPNAKSLDLTLIPEEKSLQGVVVRVHAKTPEQNIDPLNSWLKRPLERRRRATDYLTMGENTLTSAEISNAMAFWWQKIAPQGIPGIDFKSDILYETLPYNVTTYDFSMQQHDLGAYYTELGLCASITLDVTDSLIFAVNSEQLLPSLTWYDKHQFKAPIPISVSPTDSKNSYKTKLIDPGLVTICSEEPLLTNWRTASSTPILTSYAGSYLVNEFASVDFDIEPNSNLNIDVRALQSSQLNVVVYDKRNLAIEDYTVTLKGEVSDFDRLITDTTQRQRVGMLNSYYLRTPDNAHHLKISAEKDVYVRLKSRLTDFNYQRTISHQYLPEPINGFYDIAAWYEQRAANHYELTQLAHFTNIRTFTPPKEPDLVTTFYQSKELFAKLPLSNVALVLSPDRYFMPKLPPQVFNFGLYNKNNYSPYDDSEDNSLVYRLTNKSSKEVAMSELSVEALQQLQSQAKTIYQNWYGDRPWIKQRIYQLDKNTPLTLDFTKQQRPMSLVFKVFRANSSEPVELSLTQNADYKAGLTSEYSIAKQRFMLHQSALLDAFLIHPKNSQLTSYPSVTQTITNDIAELHSLTLQTTDTVWVSILEEYPLQEQKVRWWNHEN